MIAPCAYPVLIKSLGLYTNLSRFAGLSPNQPDVPHVLDSH